MRKRKKSEEYKMCDNTKFGSGRESGGGNSERRVTPAHEDAGSVAANPAEPCIAPECVNLADYGIVCGQHIQDGPLAHLNWATDCIRELEEAERTCKAANESQRSTILELQTALAEMQLEAGSQGFEIVKRGHAWAFLNRRAEKAEAEFAIAQQTIDGLAEARCPCCDGFYDDHVTGKTECDMLKVELKKWADDCAVHIEANLALKTCVERLKGWLSSIPAIARAKGWDIDKDDEVVE